VGVEFLNWNEDETRYWPSERRNEVKEFILRRGDIVIAMDRPFVSEGFKIAKVMENDLPALLLQRVGRFIPSEHIHNEYLWAYLHAPVFRHHLLKNQQGTDLPHISKFDIESAPIQLRPMNEQIHIATRFQSLSNALGQAKTHMLKLTTLKQSLLSRLLSRELQDLHV
jgi:type I restriction enzyme, S subunit